MLLLLAGCAPDGAGPLVVAFAGGRGYWPADSRTAVEGALDLGFEGLELGVELAADDVPFVWHGPDLVGCTDAAGELPDDAWRVVRDLSSDELATDVLCGGIPDPWFDQALVVAEPPLSFDELLGLLRDRAAPDLVLHLYAGHVRGASARPELVAEQVLDRWIDADLPQSLVVTSEVPDVIRAFEG